MPEPLVVEFREGEDDSYLENEDEQIQQDGEELEDGDEDEEGEEVDEADEDLDEEDEDDGEPAKLILGKFKTVQDLEKAYQEAQKALSQRGGKDTNSMRLNTPESTTTEQTDGSIDFSAVEQEVAENGEVSEETYKALETAKVPRSAVDRYVRGLQAEAAQLRLGLAEAVGGEENLGSVLKWARANLSASEKAFFDRSIDAGDPAAARLALEGIHSRYLAENKSGKRVRGDTTRRTAGVKPFRSLDDYADAIEDPKYKKDSKYRKLVDKRMQVSSF